MLYHRIVGLVGVVIVTLPIGGSVVYLYISHPHTAIYAYLGIEKVGACIGVESARINHLHSPSIGSDKMGGVAQLVLPYILHQFFHKNTFLC